MFFQRKPILRAAAGLVCAAMLSGSVCATEVASGEQFPLSAPDFAGTEALQGICVTAIPESGAVLLGDRQVRSGDVLTAGQLSLLTYVSVSSEEDAVACIRYLPILADRVEEEAELVISIRGKRDEAPTASDSAAETYKNLPIEGLLTAADPESQALTYTLVRSPRRGEVILREDGSFLYTPDKNKVGTDSFTFTAADPAGNLSPEATVTIEIRKPSDDVRYADTGSFAAHWLRETGIFSGETLNGQLCFSPDKSVSRGQFLAMLMQTLELPVDRNAQVTGFLDESPDWLKPYLAAALRSGIIRGCPVDGGVEFQPDRAVTADEAAIMVRSALNFAVPASALDGSGEEPLALPVGMDPLTRADAAELLYDVSCFRQENTLFTSWFRS